MRRPGFSDGEMIHGGGMFLMRVIRPEAEKDDQVFDQPLGFFAVPDWGVGDEVF
jgi:hypothetical protein